MDKAIRTSISEALTLVSTALVPICGCAIYIVTKNIMCIDPMNHASRTIKQCASPLLTRASVKILVIARHIPALDDCRIRLEYPTSGRLIGVAPCNICAAMVQINIRASPSLAINLGIMPPVHVARGTRVGVAFALLSTTKSVGCI
jgi:hypothetical protein